MTYNRDNIVGVEFTVKFCETVFKIEGIKDEKSLIITWVNDGQICRTESYSIFLTLLYLNYGTWAVVKKSKV